MKLKCAYVRVALQLVYSLSVVVKSKGATLMYCIVHNLLKFYAGRLDSL